MIQMLNNIEKVDSKNTSTNVKASELIEGINRVEKRAEKLGNNIQDIKKRIEEMQELIKYKIEDNNRIEPQEVTEDNIDILDNNEEENLGEGDNDEK